MCAALVDAVRVGVNRQGGQAGGRKRGTRVLTVGGREDDPRIGATRDEVWKGTITLSTGLPLSTQGDTAALGGEG
jgi:hypothetical protein